jgi:Tfp pilus assembly protein PilE
VTLLELLIVLVMTVFLTAALSFAFNQAIIVERHREQSRAELNVTDTTERTIAQLIKGARLAAGTEAKSTFFIGVQQTAGNGLGCDRLTFTTTAPGVSPAAYISTDDFETQQNDRGPQGGLAEVSLSTNPIGDSDGRRGLIERLQRPSDADPTQGGMETVLDPTISAIGFRFWDGSRWSDSWDTYSNSNMMPSAVQVSYLLSTDPDRKVRMFYVPILAVGNPSAQQAAANTVTTAITTSPGGAQ